MTARRTATATATPILHHAELASTNVEAMRLAASGEAGPLWVTADVQTAGKGRSGRQWHGAAGNLHASYLFATPAPVTVAHQLSLVTGVAAFDAIAALGIGRDRGLRLKWPNDVLIGTAKAGGILVESTSLPGRRDLVAVLGIGLNLATHPHIAGREVVSLAAVGSTANPSEALDALDAALQKALSLWNAGHGFAALRAAWLQRAGPHGERISIQSPAGALSGTFEGLDDDGALLIAVDDGERRRCTYGDVTLD